MATIKEQFINLIHRIYRKDDFINDFIGAISVQIQKPLTKIIRLSTLLYFDRLDEDGCAWWENHLRIKSIAATLKNRQAVIKAKWLGNGHNSITLIKNICNSWENGEVEPSYINGKLKLSFSGDYGVPDDLDALLEAIEEIKPAYIPYEYNFNFLLIKDIHNVMTLEEMQNTTIQEYAMGERL